MAKHIEIPSSITSCEFYKKGHTHKDGMNVVDNEQLFCLEKYRQIPICRTDGSGGNSSALVIFREQSTVKYNKQIQMERI